MPYKLFRAMAMLASGRECRVCGEQVAPSDPFGVSEGVCAACRQ